MSTFEKLNIPFFEGDIQSIDFTAAAGFVDSYTSDPDRPSGDNDIFLVYDDRLRNDYVTNRAVRFDKSRSLKRKYVKVVNNIPYYIYVFCVKPGVGNTNGIVHLTSEQKVSVLQFWNFPKELVKMLVGDSSIATEYTHSMPLADYVEGYSEEGFTIQKEEASS